MSNQTLSSRDIEIDRVCVKCKEIRPIESFSPHDSSKNGRRPDCKLCVSKRAKEYRQSNPEVRARGLKQSRDWYRANKEKAINSAKQWNQENKERRAELKLKKAFGISMAEYQTMLAAQNGSCAICQRPRSDFLIALAVDHDHDTGKIRGLLCKDCNTAIGLFGDKSSVLSNATAYLRKAGK